MDLREKLKILSDAAKYDVSCSSSGSNRKGKKGFLGNAIESGICHSFTPDGRCISLLKILLTNYCIYDCAYCINRRSNDSLRAAFTPEEVCEITINFYRRNYIEGLFLSSAVFRNPNYTMELLLKTLKLLREVHRFNGYIHVKAIPGADKALIEKLGLYADRMSVNIELPSANSLKLLAPEKSKDNILEPMKVIKTGIQSYSENKKVIRSTPIFVPGGQSTQLIVGATGETDLQILNLSEGLYNKYDLKRVYYSAYVPIASSSKHLSNIVAPPLTREHRLYQADWLLRYYGFKAKELLDTSKPNFNLKLDPKTCWAVNNMHLFPVEINRAPYEMLLRIPGVGVKSAQKIIKTRKVHILSYNDLKTLGIVLKRAQYFILCNGKYFGDIPFASSLIEERLSDNNIINKGLNSNIHQISFFDKLALPSIADRITSLTGEL
ncbi:putative DNA modification/repair radical SAM protein [Clostridium sp. 'White wine YQ']|uniref:putative DNA modification/repair radical SAM protein n=1 Tax=Clostridium sp. 'White wine YQ' TaxID=3027474 RepID=UPI002365AA0C|nr:putative DNA modification/repair radical SAM protein [Clostridium sp. 'White wine YQ']MDD7792667.1 putative DNA modification/repair radical SAM protein [Clostridium sp. 'White wine YQ']